MGISDPAWFYSSLAQTSAAIVGLIGGLLVSRLIDHGASLRAQRRDIEQAAALVKATIRAEVTNWRDAVEGLEKEVRRAQQGQASRVHADPLSDYIARSYSWAEWGFGGASPAANMDPPDEYISSARSMLRDLSIALQASPSLVGLLTCVDLEQAAQSRRAAAREVEDQEGYRLLEKHAEALQGLSRHLRNLEGSLLPKSLGLIAVLLLWLATTGILWPLAVLPGLGQSITKGSMLISLALGLVALNVYVAHELWALRQVAVLRWEDE
jgi:hypothetical protein